MGPLEIAEPEASLPAPELGAEPEVVVKPGPYHLQGIDSITKIKAQGERLISVYIKNQVHNYFTF